MAKRILVVEDNDLNRKLFCDVLRSQGYGVEPVADGLEALARARDFVPNLIIMDIQLPNVSGLDLIEGAKRDPVLRGIPVLAVTAYAGKGDEERIAMPGPRVIWPNLCRSGRSWRRCGLWSNRPLLDFCAGERLGGPNCAAFLPPRGWPQPF
jgi:two-component system cell cycle response regulator DivK